MTTAEDVLKLFMKFNPRMEFSDSPSGFFGGLRETFDRLAQEEALACRWEGLEPIDYPSFGKRDDDYEEIRPFYSVWNGFATKKSFAWKDVYRYSEAPDRRVRRLMEKENRRLRDEAMRKFNDAVRSLVAFVRKRDPRCKTTVQSEAERQKSLRDAAAAQAARSRAAFEAKLGEHVVPDWAQSEQPEETVLSDSEFEAKESTHFECVVCNKSFKSEKQIEAHERSKKHIKAVKQVQFEMRAQDKHMQQQQPSKPEPDESTPETSSVISEDGHDVPVNDEHGSLPNNVSDHEKPEVTFTEVPSSTSDNNKSPNDSGDSESIDEDYASREEVEGRLAANNNDNDNDKNDNRNKPSYDSDDHAAKSLTEAMSATSVSKESNGAKVGKAKQKRAKKAAQAGAAEDETSSSSSFTCSTCQSSFSSKTKLFNHIKSLNHAQPILKPAKALSAKSAKKKGQRR